MKYKMIALDVDGTLLNNKRELSETNKRALLKAQEEMGVRLILASGRPIEGLTKIAEELQLRDHSGYILPYNGAQIINCRTGKTISEHSIPLDTIKRLYNLSLGQGVNFLTYADHRVVSENVNDPYIKEEAEKNNMPTLEVPNILDFIKKAPAKCMIAGEPAQMDTLEALIKQQLPGLVTVTRSAMAFIELAPWNIHKKQSIAALLDKLDYNRQELIAVGDSYHDVEMIQYAGLGVAVSNAKEAVKACADYVTMSNEEDGIAHMIEKFVFSEYEDAPYSLDEINSLMPNSLMGNLGIVCTALGRGYAEATMPVDIRTRQPMGILHGGANLALAETVAGLGSVALLEPGEMQVGMQVSGNHISSALEGDVMRAEGRIMHQGKSTHVWSVEIYSTKSGKLICTVRVVNSILKQR
ncbi:Cof-type HAD-IIB family hydrolase [Porphyromonas macacae]|uniref:Cof-type HAD-IIB family hydrolase n=1 Tax=Porphyromonas macacae TaxID=28115 RepID=UPI0024ACA186|nr:Cof-type HAD-IIB family hydrolase [Porphyromonas macacae]